MQQMPPHGPVHAGGRAAESLAGSTRRCSRLCRRASTAIRGHAAAPADGRASVRHDQMLDGTDTFPDDDAAEGGNRDGAQRARLQHEARDDHCGRTSADGGGASVIARPNRHIGEPLKAPQKTHKAAARDFGQSRRENDHLLAFRQSSGTFRTGWAQSRRRPAFHNVGNHRTTGS